MMSLRTAWITNLLIIDDDIEDQEIFIEAVREVNDSIHCFTSGSGDDALRQLQQSGFVLPDVIFLDLNMPKLNGKQVLKELKEKPPLKHIPVIMYSTSFAPRDIDEIQKLGAAFHLMKPSKFNDLCRLLNDILSRDWRVRS